MIVLFEEYLLKCPRYKYCMFVDSNKIKFGINSQSTLIDAKMSVI